LFLLDPPYWLWESNISVGRRSWNSLASYLSSYQPRRLTLGEPAPGCGVCCGLTVLGVGCHCVSAVQVTGFFVLESFVSRVTDDLLGPQEAAQVGVESALVRGQRKHSGVSAA
jgi:hypothetical protein